MKIINKEIQTEASKNLIKNYVNMLNRMPVNGSKEKCNQWMDGPPEKYGTFQLQKRVQKCLPFTALPWSDRKFKK